MVNLTITTMGIIVQIIREIMKKLTNKEIVKLYYNELWNKQNKVHRYFI